MKAIPSLDELRKLNPDSLQRISDDLKSFVLNATKEKAGHLASSLGVARYLFGLFANCISYTCTQTFFASDEAPGVFRSHILQLYSTEPRIQVKWSYLSGCSKIGERVPTRFHVLFSFFCDDVRRDLRKK